MQRTENPAKKKGLKKWLKKYHKWVSLILSLFILLFSLSGIVLNHRKTFSGTDVSRNFLPSKYHFNNWNLAAIKGSLHISGDSTLIFGNIGIYLTNNHFDELADFNQGLPKGTDFRKISSLALDLDGNLFAASYFGLYERKVTDSLWRKLELPTETERIVKVLTMGDSVLVMNRSELFLKYPKVSEFRKIELPAPADYLPKTGLFRTLWMIHSGEIYGLFGKLLVDALALICIFLTLSGLIYVIAPSLIKRVSIKWKENIRRVNRFTLKWHNLLGVWSVGFLIVTSVTGIFLRPPFLIAIANAKISPIPFSVLDCENPWNDKLRDIVYDGTENGFMISTSEGMYFGHLEDALLYPFTYQPSVSVMGINVLKKVKDGEYLIGSFSGMFRWFPASGQVLDYFTAQPYKANRGGSPIGKNTISGYIEKQDGTPIIFDYGLGALSPQQNAIKSMRDSGLDKLPISLWNLALEVHTGRIWEFALGSFYILIVPLTGLSMLFILITGLWLWIHKRRKS
ncbi:MAG: PepSY-associated TM helix domain-containing protein [Bacteroidales bacterium]|nr:PepSY-associated TM helix domain-containing protein [Bacteroidales bacterium]